MKNKLSFLVPLAVVMIFSSCEKDNQKDDNAVVIKAAGDIHDDIDAFRHLLGDQLNTAPGATGGRREINWDGVPDSMLGKTLPSDFFNSKDPAASNNLKKGLAYGDNGEFRVSNANFTEVNSQAAGQFAAFSGNKTFANVNSNLWEVGFEVAGQLKTASVQGFGVVVADVDLATSTSLEFFNGTKSLGKFFVPAHDATSKFSFLGVYFKNNERITRVVVSHDGILTDNQKDISDNGAHDLVILDDFLYSEPVQQ
jgi:hypothetical protein